MKIIILFFCLDTKVFKQIFFLSFDFYLRLWHIKIIDIKILNNFLRIIKYKSIILFLIFILANLFNLILNFILIIFNIKNIFNFLFIFIINNNW